MDNNKGNKTEVQYKYYTNKDGKNIRINIKKFRRALVAGALVIVMAGTALGLAIHDKITDTSNAKDVDPEAETKTEQQTDEGFYSDWTEEEIQELAKERADEFCMTEEDYAETIRFLDGEDPKQTDMSTDTFLEQCYYTHDYNSNLDRKVEATIEVMSGNVEVNGPDKDSKNITDWNHFNEDFEKGSYEYNLLEWYEGLIDNALEDPEQVPELFKQTVLMWSEEDAVEIKGMPANKIIRNDAGVATKLIDLTYTAVSPLVGQYFNDNDLVTVMAEDQMVLENANPIDFIEQEVIGAENTCFVPDDKAQDADFSMNHDPLNTLVKNREDAINNLSKNTSSVDSFQRVRS